MKKIAKILSVVLCMVMVLGLMATTTFAASEDTAGLVVNFSSLKAGDKVIIASPSAKVAISTANSNNNRKTVAVSITNNVVALSSDVQIMELVAGSQANTFRFKAVNGEYAGKILYAGSSSSNHLKWGSQPDKNSDFSIVIAADGTAAIKSMGGASRCHMTCNSGNSSGAIISCYDSAKYDSLAIYKVGADAENAGVVEIPKMTIAEAKVAAADTEVEITGTVTMVSGKNVYVADAENANGILVYLKSNPDLKVGDTVTVVGKTTTYGGAPELTNATYTKGTAATLTAKTVTLPVTKDHVGTYVTISGLKVTEIETSNNNTYVTVTDGTNTIEIYKAVLGDLDLAVGDTITYTGTVGYYNAVQLQHTAATEIEITEKAQVTPPAGGEGDDGGDVTPPAGDDDDDKDDDVVVTPPAGGTGSATGTAPVAGGTYKLGLWQASLKEYYYFAGTVANKDYYMQTTADFAAATDVTVEAVEGGYRLSFMDGSTKKYLDIYVSGTYVNARITDAPTAVYTWNATHKTFVANIDGTEYYLGTYTSFNDDGTIKGDYTTLSASKLSYLSGDSSYPTHFYAEQPAKTGDISSVFVALLAVSAIGAGALISKKGKFVA